MDLIFKAFTLELSKAVFFKQLSANDYRDSFNRLFDLVVKSIAIGARGLGLDSRSGQIGQSVANGSPPL